MDRQGGIGSEREQKERQGAGWGQRERERERESRKNGPGGAAWRGGGAARYLLDGAVEVRQLHHEKAARERVVEEGRDGRAAALPTRGA
eukprot:189323-Prymnesium_polylepis.1